MLDATQFDDTYMYGYGYHYELPKMKQIATVSIPTSPYYVDAGMFGDIIGVVPCSDGIVYLIRIPESVFVKGPTAPEYPETPKGANGPNRPYLELVDCKLEHSRG